MKNVMIKLGGSVITDINKEGVAKEYEIERILNEIKSILNEKRVIIGHGSGSFAHVPAHKYSISKGIVNEQSVVGTSITQDSAAKLNRIVIKCALNIGLTPFSFAPSSSAISNNGRIEKWDISPIIKAMELGFIPITYGDVILDKSKGISIGSTEEVFRHIASYVKPQKIIIGTDVDGIFDSDPKINPDAILIKNVDNKNIKDVLVGSGDSRKIDVTGGMRSKVEYLYNISKETGAECQIINISSKGRLHDALLEKKVIGTIINGN